MTTTFRLATLNIWGLPAPMSWPPRRVRFPRIARFLDEHAFDVIALQELWRTPLRPSFARPGLIAPRSHEPNSGLAIGTQHRVVETEHVAYGLGAPFVEGLWTAKGTLRASIDVGGVVVDVVDTHTQAYRAPKWAALRAKHLAAALEIARRRPGPVVLCGDFNVYARIESDQAALRAIEREGFVDAVVAFDPQPTFDMFGERERFDRVYVRGLTPVAAKVHVDAHLADHRPVECTLAVP